MTAYSPLLDILRKQLCKFRHSIIGIEVDAIEGQLCHEPRESYGGLRSITGPFLRSFATEFGWKQHLIKTRPSYPDDPVEVNAVTIKRELSIAY